MHKFDKESCSNHIFRLDGEEVNVLLYAGGSSDVMYSCALISKDDFSRLTGESTTEDNFIFESNGEVFIDTMALLDGRYGELCLALHGWSMVLVFSFDEQVANDRLEETNGFTDDNSLQRCISEYHLHLEVSTLMVNRLGSKRNMNEMTCDEMKEAIRGEFLYPDFRELVDGLKLKMECELL
jgi:hypothetical protein